MSETQGLEAFLPQLSAMPEVRAELESTFKERTDEVLAQLAKGDLSTDDARVAFDLIHDLVYNESAEVSSVDGWSTSTDDVFPITVMRFGPVFYVTALELDNLEFFSSAADAEEAAASEHFEWILQAEEHAREEEEDDRTETERGNLTEEEARDKQMRALFKLGAHYFATYWREFEHMPMFEVWLANVLHDMPSESHSMLTPRLERVWMDIQKEIELDAQAAGSPSDLPGSVEDWRVSTSEPEVH